MSALETAPNHSAIVFGHIKWNVFHGSIHPQKFFQHGSDEQRAELLKKVKYLGNGDHLDSQKSTIKSKT